MRSPYEGPAFPPGALAEDYGFGLTKREFIASSMMAAIISNPSIAGGPIGLSDKNLRNIADFAVAAADLLLERLEPETHCNVDEEEAALVSRQ